MSCIQKIPNLNRIARVLASASFAVLSLASHAAVAEPLDLDPSFSGDGKVVTNFNLSPQFAQDIGKAIAVQQDGNIVAVGSAYNGSQKGYDLALSRYTTNGSLDNQFGTAGKVVTDFTSTDDYAVGVVIQPDGKIVVAATVNNKTGESKSFDFALARYNLDGSLDQSFGTNGLSRVDFGAYEAASGLALQQDGKIVVAGQQEPTSNDSNFLLARFLSNGTLDPAFGDAGKVVTDFGAWDIAWAVDIQSDGKIVAVGSTWGPNFQPVHGALARYTPEGALDGSFNKGKALYCVVLQSCGRVLVDLGGGFYDYPLSVALRKSDGTADGKIVVAGQFGVARFHSNGALDKDFANAGLMDKPDNTGAAVAILANDHIVVAGGSASDFAVAVYEPLGERCSGEGAVTTDFNGDLDQVQAIAVQSDGKILAGGIAGNGTDWDFGLARYKGGDCAPNIWWGQFVMVHIFVHPQDLVGPPAPIFRHEPYNRLQIGPSEQLLIPASEGGAFAGPMRPGYQAFKLTEGGWEGGRNAPFIAVTNVMGNPLLELGEAYQLLVPTDIAEGTGRVAASETRSQSMPLLKCYRVKMHSDDSQPVKKPFTMTDALARRRSFEIGEPESLCKPIDRRGRELVGPALSLVGYRVKPTKQPSREPTSVRLSTANEFGARVLEAQNLELVLIPSIAGEAHLVSR